MSAADVDELRKHEVGDVVVRDSGENLMTLRLGSTYEVVRVADSEGGKQMLVWVEDVEGRRCVANPGRFRPATTDEVCDFYQGCAQNDRAVLRAVRADVEATKGLVQGALDGTTHCAVMLHQVLDALVSVLSMEAARCGETNGVASPERALERTLVLLNGSEKAAEVMERLRTGKKKDDDGPLTPPAGGSKVPLN